jgi:hypothetical protein
VFEDAMVVVVMSLSELLDIVLLAGVMLVSIEVDAQSTSLILDLIVLEKRPYHC